MVSRRNRGFNDFDNFMRLPSLPHNPRARGLLAGLTLALSILLAAYLLLPRLLDPEAIKGRVQERASASLSGQFEWAWLPLPHLKLRAATLAGKDVELNLPSADIYPDWWFLLSGTVRPGRVILTKPLLRIKRLPERFDKAADPELAGLKLLIRDGELFLESNDQFPGIKSRDLSVSAINGTLTNRPESISFKLKGKPLAGEALSVSGFFLPRDLSFKLNYSCRKLNLRRIFHSFAEGRLAPLDTPVNLSGSLEGQGKNRLNGKVSGDSPCLLYVPDKISLSCGIIDLGFTRSGDDFSLFIKELELREPGLKLAGTLSRTTGGNAGAKPVWLIDLSGEELNLSRIRKTILTLWGDNQVVQKICGIIQGGTAGKAAFKFKGSAALLEYTRNLWISAEKVDASLVIPHGNLSLTGVKGRMLIDKGLLSVDAEEAFLGKSRGRKGRLLLGLPDDDFRFKLDVALEADLAELHPLLERLVEQPGFRAELDKLGDLSGRASGQLQIGDNLKDFQVKIKVNDFKARGRYQPLAFPFTIESGELDIGPSLVQWHNLRGRYGPHLLGRSSGQVRWPDEVFFDLTRLDAVLAAKELAKEDLSFFRRISGSLSEYLSGAEGRIEIRNATASGKASEAEKLKVSAEIEVRDLGITSPLFPETIFIKQAQGGISEKALSIKEARGSVFGDTFNLSADLTHQSFASPRGKLEIEGRAGPRLGQWLKEKRLINPVLFPQFPARVKSLRLDMQGEKTMAKGTIQQENDLFTTPAKADIALEFARDIPLKMSAVISGKGEEAQIGLELLDPGKETFLFSWQGSLSGKTLDKLLERKDLLNGHLAGNFQIYLPQDPARVAFSGEIEGRDLRWFPQEDSGRFIDILDLKLSGVGRHLKVSRLNCLLDGREEVRISGLIARGSEGFTLDLDLSSPYLTRETLLDFQQSLFGQSGAGSETASSKKSGHTSWNLTGNVNFAVKEFISGPHNGGASLPLAWRPLRGKLTLHPGGQIAAEINEGNICCLEATGQWFSAPALGHNAFLLKSACTPLPRFENVLPCLGYPQDIIEGEFTLSGHLEGGLKNWQSGNLRIESRDGRILRLQLLSRIFSLINVTDLFNNTPNNSSSPGFPYKELVLSAHVKDNVLIIDEATVRGQGLNLFARGGMNLNTIEMDVVVMISPFKTLDAIVSKVPFVGTIIGGKTATLVTFPVGVTGRADDPQVTLLPPGAVGESLLEIVKRTLLLPFYIISPTGLENGN